MGERIQRLSKYLTYKGISDNQATIMCGLSNGLIGKAKTGRNDISLSTCNKILDKFDDLERNWLLTGEGEMLKPPAANVVENTNNSGSITQTTTTAAPSPSSAALDRALSEIAEQRKLVADSHALTAASQAQVDRLLAIIENMTSRK